MKIHSIFGTHRLKETYGQQHQKKEPAIVEDQQEYEIEKITGERDDQFRVKWKDYERETWEPRKNLTNCAEALRNWKRGRNNGGN